MTSFYNGIARYAPLCLYRFHLVQSHQPLEAEEFTLYYTDAAKIESVADKLRWYRHKKGLLQRDVADYAKVDRSTYSCYEESERNFYPADKMELIAKLLEVPIEALLDDYNLFLYRGQGQQLRETRRNRGLTQRAYADELGVPIGTLKKWEADRVHMFKSTWEKLFRAK